jgi:hypothetical protein
MVVNVGTPRTAKGTIFVVALPEVTEILACPGDALLEMVIVVVIVVGVCEMTEPRDTPG